MDVEELRQRYKDITIPSEYNSRLHRQNPDGARVIN